MVVEEKVRRWWVAKQERGRVLGRSANVVAERVLGVRSEE